MCKTMLRIQPSFRDRIRIRDFRKTLGVKERFQGMLEIPSLLAMSGIWTQIPTDSYLLSNVNSSNTRILRHSHSPHQSLYLCAYTREMGRLDH